MGRSTAGKLAEAFVGVVSEHDRSPTDRVRSAICSESRPGGCELGGGSNEEWSPVEVDDRRNGQSDEEDVARSTLTGDGLPTLARSARGDEGGTPRELQALSRPGVSSEYVGCELWLGEGRLIWSTSLGRRVVHSASTRVALSSPTAPRPTSSRRLRMDDLEVAALEKDGSSRPSSAADRSRSSGSSASACSASRRILMGR